MVFGKDSAARIYLIVGLVGSAAWCLVSCVILWFGNGPLQRLDYKVFDFKLSSMAKAEKSLHIVHLDVDDLAVERFGQWPWNRKRSAEIIDHLSRLGARVVVFDILYTAQSKKPEDDEALFQATARPGNVIHAMAPTALASEVRQVPFQWGDDRAEAVYKKSWKVKGIERFVFPKVRELSNSALPLIPLTTKARSVGHIAATPDGDGVHRRIPLFVQLADRLIPSLSLAALCAYFDVGPEAVELTGRGTINITHHKGVLSIPVDAYGNLLINWRPTWESFDHLSALDLFTQEPDAGKSPRYKDKIVIVAVTRTGATDMGTIPLEPLALLNRVHSSALETMLSGRFLREMPVYYPVTVCLIMVALVCFLLVTRVSLWPGLLLCCVLFGLDLAAVYSAFALAGIEISLVRPMFVFIPATAYMIICRALGDEKARDDLQETFGRYISKRVVKEILKSPGGASLRGELKDITMLVSDLREFTPLTETFPPATILKIINRYLERMTDIIIRHGGTINEVTGDGILVFFGAPQELEHAPGRAVACALEMQSSMAGLNLENRDLGLPELKMGIGINCGEVVVGNIGSEKRKKYGALGSAVNVAFRIQAHAKQGEVLITHEVYHRAAVELTIGSSREVRLKGIAEPITLYEVL